MKKSFNRRVREFMWANHGCPLPNLYGDDGELQCNECMIDFRRMKIVDILEKVSCKDKINDEDIDDEGEENNHYERYGYKL